MTSRMQTMKRNEAMEDHDLLRIAGLYKRYDDFALEGIDLAVPAGSIVGFVGANGAGKTTTLKCALGLVRPDGGSLRLFGEEVAAGNPAFVGAHRFAELRQDVGVVLDTCAFPEDYTIDMARTFCAKAYRRWDDDAFSQLARALQLNMNRKVKDLSRGMGMKLSLACALAHRPRLLVLDEATAGLDPLARDEALDILRAYLDREESAVLMSSHITSDLEKAADEIVCIDGGRIVFDRPVFELTDTAGVARCSGDALEKLRRVFGEGELFARRHAYSTDVLVPDRFAFAEAFPEVPVDRVDIDEYLALTLKGERL